MATVRFADATRVYTEGARPAVNRLDLDIADGEFLVLVGPSGCGKSTALRMLAGLEPINGGRIWVDDRDVTNVAAKDRDIAMVFQNYALYPHMSVAENMGFALEIARVDKAEIRRRVAVAAKLLDLEPYLQRKPKALSGGQRQRVAMGRAIVREPLVFLMDEPLSNLDAKLRVSTRTQIAALQRRLGTTTVYVTHDQVEAMTMGDRVAVLKDGLLQQCATSRELFDRPVNVFVAGFIGSPQMNIQEFPLDGDVADFGHGVPPMRVPRQIADQAHADGSGKITLGFRPDALELGAGDDAIPVVVDVVEELGADAYAYGHLSERIMAAEGGMIVARLHPSEAPVKGSTIHLRVRPGETHAFSTANGLRLGQF